MANIFFNYPQKRIMFSNAGKVKSFIVDIFRDYGLVISRLDYIFCTDKYLLQINKKYLSHNYYTDVISFCLDKTEKSITGEVYISFERVKENATLYKVSFNDEMLRVIFHGALHLCGGTDNSEAEKKNMTIAENYYIDKFVSRATVSPRNSGT